MIHKEGKDRIRATYLDNYDRLLELKNKYGPANQNIRPTCWTVAVALARSRLASPKL